MEQITLVKSSRLALGIRSLNQIGRAAVLPQTPTEGLRNQVMTYQESLQKFLIFLKLFTMSQERHPPSHCDCKVLLG